MNFCLVYLRSRLPCILGRPSRFRITNSCSGTWRMVGARVLKCFLLPSSTLSKNTFSSEGNGRDFLTSSTSSRLSSKSCACPSVTDGLTMMCMCWTDGLTGGFLHWQSEIVGRNHHLSAKPRPTLFICGTLGRETSLSPTTNWCPSDTLVEW